MTKEEYEKIKLDFKKRKLNAQSNIPNEKKNEDPSKLNVIMSSLNYFSSHIRPLYKATKLKSHMPQLGISIEADIHSNELDPATKYELRVKLFKKMKDFFKERSNIISLNFRFIKSGKNLLGIFTTWRHVAVRIFVSFYNFQHFLTLVVQLYVFLVRTNFQYLNVKSVDNSNRITESLFFERGFDKLENDEENPGYDEEVSEDSYFMRDRQTLFWRPWQNTKYTFTASNPYNLWHDKYKKNWLKHFKGMKASFFKYVPFFKPSRGLRFNYPQHHLHYFSRSPGWKLQIAYWTAQIDMLDEGSFRTISNIEESESFFLDYLHKHYDESRESAHFRNSVLYDRILGSSAYFLRYFKYTGTPIYPFDYRFSALTLSVIYKYISNAFRVRIVFFGDWFEFYYLKKTLADRFEDFSNKPRTNKSLKRIETILAYVKKLKRLINHDN